MIIRYGDSIRAYGLGIALMLLVLGAMWRSGRVIHARPRGDSRRLSAVLSVQCLYYNSVLLLAICLGAASVTLRRRQFKETLIVFAIGGISAATLLPYVPTIQRVHSWNFIWKAPFTPGELWRTLGSRLEIAAWTLSVRLGAYRRNLGDGAPACRRRRPGKNRARPFWTGDSRDRHRRLRRIHLLVLGYLTQPWYYIAFLAFAATCMEMVLDRRFDEELFAFSRAPGHSCDRERRSVSGLASAAFSTNERGRSGGAVADAGCPR